jgi:muramoyltetrapeptide carboxypeptidase
VSHLRPPALRRGDRVGVCAPAGPVEGERLERGLAELAALGFEPVLGRSLGARHRFTAGTIGERLADLDGFLRDGSIAGVFAARGGSGAGWLLDGLDAASVRARPKAVVGYSDLTVVHLWLDRLGIASVHGPMVARGLSEGEAGYDRASLLHALTAEGEPVATDALAPLRRGRAEGVLRGGCLALLAGAAGTPFALGSPGEETVLFLEDVDERPYRLDRMLLQLRRSGAFANVKGVVFGDMKGCAPRPGEGYTLEDVLLDALDGLDAAVAFGLPSGHTDRPIVTLPLGVRARLEVGDGARFEVLEAPVA